MSISEVSTPNKIKKAVIIPYSPLKIRNAVPAQLLQIVKRHSNCQAIC